jgi:hypothetical protein
MSEAASTLIQLLSEDLAFWGYVNRNTYPIQSLASTELAARGFAWLREQQPEVEQ